MLSLGQKIKVRIVSAFDSKVIGYFAFMSSGQVACDGPSWLIFSSENEMRQYIEGSYPTDIRKFTIKKTRFCEITKGLSLGASYAFDTEAYRRFSTIAHQAKYPLDQIKSPSDNNQESSGDKFMHVFPNKIG